jgi:hypothetical protein
MIDVIFMHVFYCVATSLFSYLPPPCRQQHRSLLNMLDRHCSTCLTDIVHRPPSPSTTRIATLTTIPLPTISKRSNGAIDNAVLLSRSRSRSRQVRFEDGFNLQVLHARALQNVARRKRLHAPQLLERHDAFVSQSAQK